MNIKKIIKETLFFESAEANAKPYIWKSISQKGDLYMYEFVTAGGSNLKIIVTFFKLDYKMMSSLVDRDSRLPKETINLIKNNPQGYWDVEFSVDESGGSTLDNPYITISKSEFKSELIEFYRIAATLSKIVNDFLSKKPNIYLLLTEKIDCNERCMN